MYLYRLCRSCICNIYHIQNVIYIKNIGNIYTGIKDKLHIKNVEKCYLGSDCDKKKCWYYHDPLELAKYNIYIDKPMIRNYTNKSWIFTSSKINKKNKNMKHLGNRDSLKIDIDKFIKLDKNIIDNEIDLLINQTMHNL